MKYNLQKDLLDHNNILSHVFLNLPTDIINLLSKENDKLSSEEFDKRKIEIEVLVNGMSVDPKNFFTLFSNQWDEAVKREATKLVKEQACIERFQKLQDKFYDLEQILDNMASSINWNTENIFRKK